MSYTKAFYHIIFRTKDSVCSINGEHEKELYAYLMGMIHNCGSKLFRIGGMPDHIHIFVELNPQYSISQFVREIKKASNAFLKANDHFPMFEGWARGYAAITYSTSEKRTVVEYIKSQKEHHKIKSFAEELREILLENGIPFSEDLLLE